MGAYEPAGSYYRSHGAAGNRQHGVHRHQYNFVTATTVATVVAVETDRKALIISVRNQTAGPVVLPVLSPLRKRDLQKSDILSTLQTSQKHGGCKAATRVPTSECIETSSC